MCVLEGSGTGTDRDGQGRTGTDGDERKLEHQLSMKNAFEDLIGAGRRLARRDGAAAAPSSLHAPP